ncbi:MAG: hypothetical protein ACRDKH_08610 [Solirubrobacterales bacterium]
MRAAAIAFALCALALGACGDDDDETSAATTGTATEATSTDPVEPAGEGPAGELTERGIGVAEVGASAERVESAFGAPDRERELPGCELAGPNAIPVLEWSWDLDDGTVSLDLDVSERTVSSYRTTSSSLPTTAGIRVGDSFSALRDAYGPLLKGLPLGADPTPRAGFWYLGKPASRAWQLFDVRGGIVRTIQGGDVQICE